MHLRHLNTKILASISSINLDQNPAPHLTKQPTQPTKISRKASNKLSCTTHKCTRRFRTYILCFSRVVSPKNQCNKPEKLTLNMNKSNPRFIQNGGRDISIWKFPNKGCRCCLFLFFLFLFFFPLLGCCRRSYSWLSVVACLPWFSSTFPDVENTKCGGFSALSLFIYFSLFLLFSLILLFYDFLSFSIQVA